MKFKYNGQWYSIPFGTDNYPDLKNKPQINGVEISGNKTSADLGIITKAVNDLQNYYLKTETYTKDEVNTIVSSIQRVKIEIVDELPTEDIDTTTIYFVPKTPSENDSYDEFMYINNQWEHIGSTEVDLSNYYTKTEVDVLFDDLGTASELDAVAFNDDSNVYLEASAVSVEKQGGVLSDAQTEFNSIQTALGTVDGSVQALDTRVTTAEGNITSLNGRVKSVETDVMTATGNISNLQSAVSTLQTNTTSKGDNTHPVYMDGSGVATPISQSIGNVAGLSYTVVSTWT